MKAPHYTFHQHFALVKGTDAAGHMRLVGVQTGEGVTPRGVTTIVGVWLCTTTPCCRCTCQLRKVAGGGEVHGPSPRQGAPANARIQGPCAIRDHWHSAGIGRGWVGEGGSCCVDTALLSATARPTPHPPPRPTSPSQRPPPHLEWLWPCSWSTRLWRPASVGTGIFEVGCRGVEGSTHAGVCCCADGPSGCRFVGLQHKVGTKIVQIVQIVVAR